MKKLLIALFVLSVVSPVLATVLAVHLGFSTVVLIGLVLYAATATVFPDAAGAAE